jgi:hypothetical protein
VSVEGVEQDGELVEAVFRGGGDAARDPEPVLGSDDAGQSPGDLLLDLRGGQAAFGVVGCGWDGEVVDEAQDVVLAVAEGFQQEAGLGPCPTGRRCWGGIEEFPLLRDSRCSSFATLSTSSLIRSICASTRASSSSRDRFSRSDTS